MSQPVELEAEAVKLTSPPGIGDGIVFDGCVHVHFERQAAVRGERVAAVLDEECLTYRELNERANQVAHFLRLQGIQPETIVAVCLERSMELLVTILGILKAGGAYLPIDVMDPADRIAFVPADASAAAVVTTSQLAAGVPYDRGKKIILDCDAAVIAAQPVANPPVTARPDNLAYIIFTSGSTGSPKGVQVTHQNVVRLFAATNSWYGFNSADTWTLFHSSAFDFSVWEIWGALFFGGKLVIVPFAVSRSPEAILDLLVREQVTVLNQTPSAFRLLIEAEQHRATSSALQLRYIIFGGEALEMRILKPWFERHGDQQPQLINMYGITETTVHVTYRPITKSDVHSGSVIGIPIPDLYVHILDAQLQPVPVGTTGEMFVGGAGLARGYLNRPELTAARFIPDPFSTDPGARLYRTGDLARLLHNRDLEYVGRTDQQVKIRGFRVELGEIEAVLSQHPLVADAVVLVRDDRPGDKHLAAYIVARNDAGPSPAELRAHLKTKLPPYMTPAVFAFVKRFPLTINGKLDRAALRALTADNPRVAAVDSTADELERQIVNIWRDVLGGGSFGLEDNFFDVGGDSLRVAQVHARLRELVNRDFPITDLFAHSTIRRLAAHLGPEKPKTNSMTALRERAQRQRQAISRRGAVRP